MSYFIGGKGLWADWAQHNDCFYFTILAGASLKDEAEYL